MQKPILWTAIGGSLGTTVRAETARSFAKITASNRGQAFSSRSQRRAKMPKLKTKSGAKKRFKVTATGKVMAAHAGKRHGMIKRTKKQIRQLRGTRVLFKTDGDNIKKYFLPNA
jgi:large subunit ribosomal protein L35